MPTSEIPKTNKPILSVNMEPHTSVTTCNVLEGSPFKKKRTKVLEAVTSFLATIASAFWWVIPAIALVQRIISNPYEDPDVESGLRELNNYGLLPEVVEERKFVKRVPCSKIVHTRDHIELAEFHSRCEALHEVSLKDNLEDLPAPQLPTCERELFQAGCALMTDGFVPAEKKELFHEMACAALKPDGTVAPKVPSRITGEASLGFILRAMEQCKNNNYFEDPNIGDFQEALGRLQEHYVWLTQLESKTGDEYHKMKRQILQKIKKNLSQHHMEFIPVNNGREILQLKLETDDHSKPTIRAELLLRNDLASDPILAHRLNRVLEEKQRIKNIIFESTDYTELANSDFMESMLDQSKNNHSLSHSDWISKWPGELSFKGQEHTQDLGKHSNLLALIQEHMSSLDRAILKTKLYHSVISRLEVGFTAIETAQQLPENALPDIPIVNLLYKKILSTLDKYERRNLTIPAPLKNEVTQIAVNCVKRFGQPSERNIPLPVSRPDDLSPLVEMHIDSHRNKRKHSLSYRPVRWGELPKYEDWADGDILDYINTHKEKANEIIHTNHASKSHRKLSSNKLYKMEKQQIAVHLCEQLPDANDPIWEETQLEENNFKTLFDVLMTLMRTSFISADGGETTSAHEVTLALKVFAIITRLQDRHYANSGFTHDQKATWKILLQHYATDLYSSYESAKWYHPLLDAIDRNTRDNAIAVLKKFVVFENEKPSEQYQLLKPENTTNITTLLHHQIPISEWRIDQVLALGRSVSEGNQYNKEITLLKQLIERNLPAIVTDVIIPRISHSAINKLPDTQFKIYRLHQQKDYSAIASDNNLMTWILTYVYTDKRKLDSSINYEQNYPAELKNYLLMRRLQNVMHNMITPFSNSQIKQYTIKPEAVNIRIFKKIKPNSNPRTCHYLISGIRKSHNSKKRNEQSTSLPMNVTQSMMNAHIGKHQNQLFSEDRLIPHKLWDHDEIYHNYIHEDILRQYRQLFSETKDLGYLQALTFIERNIRYMSHPTFVALMETAWFSELLPNPTEGNKCLMDIVCNSDQDATIFINCMDTLFNKMKIEELRPPAPEYTGNFYTLKNIARLMNARTLAGAISYMTNDSRHLISSSVINKANNLLVRIWQEEMENLPKDYSENKIHSQYNNTCMVLLSLYPYIHQNCDPRLKEKTLSLWHHIHTCNTFKVNFKDYVKKTESAEIGACVSDAYRGLRIIEPELIQRNQEISRNERHEDLSQIGQLKKEIDKLPLITAPLRDVPSQLKQKFIDPDSGELLPNLTFCYHDTEGTRRKKRERIYIVDEDNRSIIAVYKHKHIYRFKTDEQGNQPLAMNSSNQTHQRLANFSRTSNREQVSLVWASPTDNKPIAIETLSSDWNWLARPDGQWASTNYPGHIVTSVSDEALFLVADDDEAKRKLITKYNDRYFSYDIDNTGKVIGFPDGIPSMVNYVLRILKQKSMSFQDISHCESIISDLSRSGQTWDFEIQWDFNALLIKEDIPPHSCALLLKLAVCRYQCNSERLRDGKNAILLLQIYETYLAMYPHLDKKHQLTHDEETTLMEAFRNRARQQSLPPEPNTDNKQTLPFILPTVIVERCRTLKCIHYTELKKWSEYKILSSDILIKPQINIDQYTEKSKLKNEDPEWENDIRLIFRKSILWRHESHDQEKMIRDCERNPEHIINSLNPDPQAFNSNLLYYYNIARNPQDPKHQLLESFLNNISSGSEHVKRQTMFLLLVMKKPELFKAVTNPDNEITHPKPEEFNLSEDYKGNAETATFELSTNLINYETALEEFDQKNTLEGRLSWYFYCAYGQNKTGLDRQTSYRIKYHKKARLLSKHKQCLPVPLKCRLNHTAPPPCEEVKYHPIALKSLAREDAKSFESLQEEMRESVGHISRDMMQYYVEATQHTREGCLTDPLSAANALQQQLKNNADPGDACYTNCMDRIISGMEIHKIQLEEQKQQPVYRLGNTHQELEQKIPRIKENLLQKARRLNGKIDTLHQQLTDELTTFESARDEEIRHHIKSSVPLSLTSLMAVVARGNPDKLKTLHPEWDDEKVNVVFNNVIRYLLLVTELQHIHRLQTQLDRMNHLLEASQSASLPRLPEAVETAHNQLVTMMNQERAYGSDTDENGEQLEFLLFEYIQNIRIRKDQVESCRKLESKPKVNAEIPTGSGKSTVILPYLCYKTLQEGQLPMLVVPPDLIEQQKEILRNGLCKAFNTEVVEFYFERSRAHDLHYLNHSLERLKRAHRDKNIILCRMSDLHAVISLKRKEILHQLANTDQDSDKLRAVLMKLDELQSFVEKQVRGIIDESKSCFNPNHSYDYAVGHQAIQTETTRTAIKEIFTCLLDVGKQQFHLDFMPADNQSETIITRENYRTRVAPLLAEHVSKLFHSPPQITGLMKRDLSMQTLDAHSRERINSFLKNHPQRELYASLRVMLRTMEHTLPRKINDSYGLNDNATCVIPYTNGTPSPRAEFASSEMNVILTAQAFLHHPFGRNMIRTWISDLIAKAQAMSPEECDGRPEFKLFERLKQQDQTTQGMTFEKLDTTRIDTLCGLLNDPKNLDLKLEYICNISLVNLKLFTQKVTSSSFNIVSAFNCLRTASGTVDPNVLPDELPTIEAQQSVIPNLLQLLQDRWDRPAGVISRANDERTRLTMLAMKNPQASVFIDAGDFFRSLSHLEIANTFQPLLNDPVNCPQGFRNKQGILVFDRKGTGWVLPRRGGKPVLFKSCGVKARDLVIVLQKFKAEGTDLLMSPDARAVVTVDNTTPSSLCIQAIGRMRQLTKGQSVDLAFMEEQKALLFGENADTADCTYGKLFCHMVREEGKQTAKQAVNLMNGYLSSRIERLTCINYLRDIGFNTKKTRRLVNDIKPFMMPLTHTNPMDLISAEAESLTWKERADKVFNEYRPLLERLKKNHPGLRQKLDINSLHKDYMQFVQTRVLPETIETLTGSASSNDKADATVEVTITLGTETEVEKEVPRRALLCLNYKPHDTIKWDGNFLKQSEKRKPEFFIGKTPVFMGPNTMLFAEKSWPRFWKTHGYNDKYQKPIYQAVVFKRPGDSNWSLFIGDLSDMAFVKAFVDQHTTTEAENANHATEATLQPSERAKKILQGVEAGCYLHDGHIPYRAWGDDDFLDDPSDERHAIIYFLKLVNLSGKYMTEAEKTAFEHLAAMPSASATGMMTFLKRLAKGFPDKLNTKVETLKTIWRGSKLLASNE